MGAMFVSQQYLQNVLGYSTLEAGAAFLPAVVCMVLVAPRSAKLVEARGARFTLLCGYVFLLLAFATMLLVWKEDISYWEIALAYASSASASGSRAHRPRTRSPVRCRAARRHGVGNGRPPARPRRRDHAVDLRRAAHGRVRRGRRRADRELRQERHGATQAELTKSFSSAANTASAYPASVQEQHHRRREDRVPPRRPVGVHGRARRGPARRGPRLLPLPEAGEEEELLARYHAEDTQPQRRPAGSEPIEVGLGAPDSA